MVTSVSENQQDVGRAAVYLGNETPIVGNNIYVIKHNQNPKFLSYMFTTKYVRNQIQKLSVPSTVFRLYAKNMKRIKIPLPPLEEQEKMVKRLDAIKGNCQELEFNVKELMESRSKQYHFYSEKILSL